jgi:hemerythrin-like domain-containing protein
MEKTFSGPSKVQTYALSLLKEREEHLLNEQMTIFRLLKKLTGDQKLEWAASRHTNNTDHKEMVEKLWVIDVRDLAKDHDTEKRLSLPVE